MEIRIYDARLDWQGTIENQTSLLWMRRYFEPGTFELHAPITPTNLALLKIGNLVTMHGQTEAGIIEDVYFEESRELNAITAQGRFLCGYMSYRVIKGTVNIDSTVEQAMHDLLRGATPIPLLEFGPVQGYPKRVQGQVTYKNLGEFMVKLARAGNIGYRFRPDFVQKKIIFETYMGVDRSIEQSENNRVTFSENYDNLNQAGYRANDQSYANVAYVIGKRNQQDLLEVVGDTDSTGLERREIYVDASGVNETDLPNEADFRAALRQEGWNTLNASHFSETIECDTSANGNFLYRKNYDLGDIVTIKKANWNMQRSLRITELQETYEYGALTVTPTFGDPLPTSIDWEG